MAASLKPLKSTGVRKVTTGIGKMAASLKPLKSTTKKLQKRHKSKLNLVGMLLRAL